MDLPIGRFEAAVDDISDDSNVRELDKDGFIDRLYR